MKSLYNKNNNSGITLVALILTIIVLLIILSISIYEGKDLIKKASVNTIVTNMQTIQAKSKSYAEEIDAKIWTESDKDTKRNEEFDKKGFKNPTNNIDSKYKNIDTSNYIAYTISPEGLSSMGLEDIKNEQYMVIYDKDDFNKIDVIYTKGINYNKTTYYTLSSLESVISDE